MILHPPEVCSYRRVFDMRTHCFSNLHASVLMQRRCSRHKGTRQSAASSSVDTRLAALLPCWRTCGREPTLTVTTTWRSAESKLLCEAQLCSSLSALQAWLRQHRTLSMTLPTPQQTNRKHASAG